VLALFVKLTEIAFLVQSVDVWVSSFFCIWVYLCQWCNSSCYYSVNFCRQLAKLWPQEKLSRFPQLMRCLTKACGYVKWLREHFIMYWRNYCSLQTEMLGLWTYCSCILSAVSATEQSVVWRQRRAAEAIAPFRQDSVGKGVVFGLSARGVRPFVRPFFQTDNVTTIPHELIEHSMKLTGIATGPYWWSD